MLNNKKLFIIGGTGSLGNKLIETYIKNNTIVCYSRDECKQWEMSLKYKSDSLTFIIGDIRDYNKLETSLLRENPDIIIIAAALKHIDRCEYSINECIETNLLGPQNVLNAVEKNKLLLIKLETVCLISTDKACSPINAYGMSKGLAEKLIVEKSYYIKDFKFVCVRYGNVLNSRGSILPILHEMGNNKQVKEFSLTHKNMTRFIMSLEESVSLIEHAIVNCESGDIVVPKLVSMRIQDLITIFSEIYNKPFKITGLRPGEKIDEVLINKIQSMTLLTDEKYCYIKPSYKTKLLPANITTEHTYKSYTSADNLVDQAQLKKLLQDLQLI